MTMQDELTIPLIDEQDVVVKEVEEVISSAGWILPELKMQLWLAGPMICVNLLQFALNLVSVMFVGHLGELALASASVATSFAGVTGFSVMIGMGSALETLCGQAYGAKQYSMLGVYLQRGVVVLTTTAIPITIIWLSMGSLLRAMGQDPEISGLAGEYARWMIPTLFAYAVLQPLVKFLQAQSAVRPMAICSALTLAIHIPNCWLLIYKLGIGYKGAAIAAGMSAWLNVTFLILYVKFSPSCQKTWVGFSSEAFHDMKAFFKLAVTSALMICLEYWSFEFMVLVSGLLPNPQLEMSSLAISLNSIALLYMIPFGLSAAASVRVSNELGAGRASAAKRAVGVSLSLAFTEGIIMSVTAFSVRNHWAKIYTNEAEVVEYVGSMVPFLAILAIFDSGQAVLCGVTRGCGNQKFGAFTNLGAYYLVGVPTAIILAFHFHMNGKGLWLGMIAALTIQETALLLFTLSINWEKQAQNALNRVWADSHLPVHPVIASKESEDVLLPQ